MNNEEKTTHYRMDFQNCGLDYDYTIVKDLHEVCAYLQLVETELDSDYEEGRQPKVTITGVPMTATEYESFLNENVKP